MINLIKSAGDELEAAIESAYTKAVKAGRLPEGEVEFSVERPRERAFGDYSSNFAMSAARVLRKSPKEIAAIVIEHMEVGNLLEGYEQAGAGFINARFSNEFYNETLKVIKREGMDYGRQDIGGGRRVLVEFVSANPTGPMTIGNARGGVLGDAIAAVLERTGHYVEREFYLNDAGNQIAKLGLSLEVRYRQQLGESDLELPEDAYHGEDVAEHARDYIAAHGDSLRNASEEERREALTAFALERNIAKMKTDLERYRISYNTWFAESSLHAGGYVEKTIAMLTERGHTYEQDGALWFKATSFGCEKDEVLRRANGYYTYYAADIAYHHDKLEKRGFDLAIDVLGADHHGHTLRFRAGLAALGIAPVRLRFVLMQLVRLMRGGEVARVSKRTGKSITLADLLDEIPVDAARFFFNLRQSDTHLVFDLDLAVRQDAENPVYYVQYAHARINSLLAELAGLGGNVPDSSDASVLTENAERELICQLASYPEELRLAARDLEPFRIERYLIDLAASFHRFYQECRIKEAGTEALRDARLLLSACTKTVLAAGLELLGVSAPEKM